MSEKKSSTTCDSSGVQITVLVIFQISIVCPVVWDLGNGKTCEDR